MSYQPIDNYGIVGNMRTVALVGINGSIDWLCFPRFDSPSVFGAILDDAKGGRFQISPACEDVQHKQFYWPETNVLVTRFLSHDGVGEVTDYMPVGPVRDQRDHLLIRRVSVARGSMPFRMICAPAFDYARTPHKTVLTNEGVAFHSSQLSLGLATVLPLQQHENGVIAEWTLEEGQTAIFVLRAIAADEASSMTVSNEEADALFKQTVAYWRHWIGKCTYTGRWREMVYRSALVLKLLTYQPTGAIVAAPTCSLPESIGAGRNWDYRYTWIRDAAFTLYALLRIGFTEEAAQFMEWLNSRCHDFDEENGLQLMYGIDGRHELPEETLHHLEGYRGSSPVRIGNGAYQQMQIDIYGELMDSVYLFNKYGTPISYDLWTHLRDQINWVCKNWQRTDHGIWEVRGEKQHFVYSKLMCWVAVDRGLRLADKRSFPADRDRWIKVRDQIYEDIMKNGWSEDRRAFVQAYHSEALDAANLLMPLVFFVSPNDPRMIQTLAAVNRAPQKGGLVSDSLVYRYNLAHTRDGLDGEEGTFSICTFWLVEAMTRAGRSDRGQLEKARLMFEQMLGYANHLGLYAEEIGPSGEALGNFPQAFTHLSLISAAFNLDRTLGRRD